MTEAEEFFRDVLGVGLWKRQRDVVEAVTTHRRVLVMSGHKTGMTYVAACIAYWWAARRGPCVALSGSGRRHYNAIFERSLEALAHGATRPGELDAVDSLVALDGLRGIGSNALIVVEDAHELAWDLWARATGSNARLLALGKAIHDGAFRRAYAAGSGHQIRVSSLESPNIYAGCMAIPGLAVSAWADSMLNEHGEQSDFYRARVLGLPPLTEAQ